MVTPLEVILSMNPSTTTVLSMVQILVGLLTLITIPFFLGKTSARVDRAEEDIQGLKDASVVADSKINDVQTRVSVIEALSPLTTNKGARKEVHHG